MTWMAAGAVQLACRAALEERERGGGGEVDVERVYRHPRTTPLDPETGQITGERAHVAFAVAAMRVVAEVDVDLGLTRVVWIGTAQDVGKAINPLAVEGQIEGGTAQGLGLALMEEIQTRDGLITNASFTDYLIPTALDMPPVVSELIEDPEPGRAVRRQGRRRAADRRLDGRGRLGAPRRDRPRAHARARAPGRHLPLGVRLGARAVVDYRRADGVRRWLIVITLEGSGDTQSVGFAHSEDRDYRVLSRRITSSVGDSRGQTLSPRLGGERA